MDKQVNLIENLRREISHVLNLNERKKTLDKANKSNVQVKDYIPTNQGEDLEDEVTKKDSKDICK